MKFLLPAVAAVLCASIAYAQEDAHAACAMTGWVPREILDRPVALRAGLGNAHEKVSTSSRQAQAFYDQGLNYLHGYVWIEAARSFRQALRHDPNLAMAYLGLSRAYYGLDDLDAARQQLERAQALAPRATEMEQRRIAIEAKHLEAVAALEDTAKHAEYKRALDDALAQNLDDPELWLLRGNAEEATAAGRGQRGKAASIAYYSMVLRLAPDSAAAHHYLIHSYETINQIDRALVHGAAFARLAPGIPHAHHMYAHDLRRVGRMKEAIAGFRKTRELELAYFAAEKIDPAYDWHYLHNLDLLASAYQYVGQMRLAEQTLREADALTPLTDYLAFYSKAYTAFLLGRQRWDDALQAARKLTQGRGAAGRAVGHAAEGHVHLALGRRAEAEQALAQAQAQLNQVPKVVPGIEPSRSIVEPNVEMLRGELLLRGARPEEGRALLKEVQRRFRAIPGPDAWVQTLFRLEHIAQMARDVGDWELAEHTARQMMEHDPKYGGSHLAVALVAAHQGRTAEARRAFDEAERAWRDADKELPELLQIRSQKTALRP